MVFSYLIAQDVCYLFLCEASFAKRSAFAYLEDLRGEFNGRYGRRVAAVTRPYSFIEFGETNLGSGKCRLQPHANRKKILIPNKPSSSRYVHPEDKEVLR